MTNRRNLLRRVSAVYTITAPDGRFYIGASKRVGKRWNDHRSKARRGEHENPNLQASFNCYGLAAHVFSIVERTTPTQLEAVEQEWLDHFFCACGPETLLNRSPTAGKANTRIRRTEAVRAARRGEGNANARLSADDVARIRSVLAECAGEWGVKSKLAREHGVCTATISKIERGQRWAVDERVGIAAPVRTA